MLPRHGRHALVALAAALAAVVTSRGAIASPEDIFGYGGRSTAMGSLGAATAQDYEAGYQNPALLARIRERKLTLGFQGAAFNLRAEGPGAGTAAPGNVGGRISASPVRAVVIGADIPVPFGGVLRDRVALGLAFSTPTDLVVRGRILYPERPQFPLLPDRAQSVALRAGVGVDLGHGLRVGVAVASLADVVGTAVLAADATGRVGTRVENQLVATYAPVVGLAYTLGDEGRSATRFGLVYRGALAARFGVTIDATKLSGITLPLFNIAGMAQYDPAQIAFEVAREQGPWVFGLGATYKRWSAYPGLLEPTVRCEDEGSCAALTPPTVPYHDTLVVRGGVEGRLDATPSMRVRLRGGAFYEPSPLPDQVPPSSAWRDGAAAVVQLPTRYFDSGRVALTTGAGLELVPPLPPITLDMALQVHTLVPRTMSSTPVASSGPGAAAGSVESRADVSGHVLLGVFTAGVRF